MSNKSFFTFTSSPGEWIGSGQTRFGNSDQGFFNCSLTNNNSSISCVEIQYKYGNEDWSFTFAPPKGSSLKIGSFKQAERYPFHTNKPGLDISGCARGCNELSGEFTISELQLDSSRTSIKKFRVQFTQLSEMDPNHKLQGELYYDSDSVGVPTETERDTYSGGPTFLVENNGQNNVNSPKGENPFASILDVLKYVAEDHNDDSMRKTVEESTDLLDQDDILSAKWMKSLPSDSELIARCYKKGVFYFDHANQLSRAQRYFSQGLDIANRLQNVQYQKIFNHYLGWTEARLGKFDSAEMCFSHFWALCTADEPEDLFTSFTDLGRMKMHQRDFKSAKQMLLQATEFPLMHDPHRLGQAWMLLGLCSHKIGDIPQACQQYYQGFKLFTKRVSQHTQQPYTKICKPQEVLELSKDAHSIPSLPGETKAIILLAESILYEGLRDHRDAVQKCKSALQLEQELDVETLQQIYHCLGDLQFFLDDNPSAIENISMAVALAPEGSPQYVLSIADLARVYAYEKQQGKAMEMLNKAKLVAETQLSSDMQLNAIVNKNFGDVLQASPNKEDKLKAVKYYTLALQTISNEPVRNDINYGIASVYFDLEDYAKAEKHLAGIVEFLGKARTYLSTDDPFKSDIWKVHTFQSQAEFFDMYIDCLVRQSKFDLALEVAEQAKGKATLDFLEHSQRRTHPVFGIKHITRTAVQHEATLIFYHVLKKDSKLCVWVVQPEEASPVHCKQIDLPQHILGVLTFSQAVEHPRKVHHSDARLSKKHTNWKQLFEELYDVLIRPIEDFLPKKDSPKGYHNLVFVATGELLAVPYPALSSANGLLLDKYVISVTPSIQVLSLCMRIYSEKENQKLKLLAVGNPTTSFASLSFAGKEAKAISAIYPDSVLLTDSKATKSAVMEHISSSTLVHFACHASLQPDPEDPNQRGCIHLAESSTDTDGDLWGSDIRKLQIPARLVVLSCCETAQGSASNDGVLGLARSFICASTPTIVASLWLVPDTTLTVELMVRFHQYLQTESPALALRTAMKEVRCLDPKSYDWAAFTLIGCGTHSEQSYIDRNRHN